MSPLNVSTDARLHYNLFYMFQTNDLTKFDVTHRAGPKVNRGCYQRLLRLLLKYIQWYILQLLDVQK